MKVYRLLTLGGFRPGNGVCPDTVYGIPVQHLLRGARFLLYRRTDGHPVSLSEKDTPWVFFWEEVEEVSPEILAGSDWILPSEKDVERRILESVGG